MNEEEVGRQRLSALTYCSKDFDFKAQLRAVTSSDGFTVDAPDCDDNVQSVLVEKPIKQVTVLNHKRKQGEGGEPEHQHEICSANGLSSVALEGDKSSAGGGQPNHRRKLNEKCKVNGPSSAALEGVQSSADKQGKGSRPNCRKKLNEKRRVDGPSAAGLEIILSSAEVNEMDCNVVDLPKANSGLTGKGDQFWMPDSAFASSSTAAPVRTALEERLSVLDPNCNGRVVDLVSNHVFRYIVNDNRVAQALTDTNGIVFAVKAQPPVGGWDNITLTAEEAFEVISAHYGETHHRRGSFKCCSFGGTGGIGSKGPHMLDQSQTDERLHQDFVDKVRRYARHFQVTACTWFPELMKDYSELQIELLGVNIYLQTAFPGCDFFATTLNMGPQTVCLAHRDFNNLAYGICGVGVLGKFNHRTGGQVILHEPKVIMEVRRGDVYFIPSASVTHENAPIQPNETRYSFTMYTSGALFRWVACGGIPVGVFKESDPQGYKSYMDKGQERWEQGWKKYSTIDSLIASAKARRRQELLDSRSTNV